MNTAWHDFLCANNAKLNDDNLINFDHDPRSEINSVLDELALISLDQLGIIQVTGEDAQNFLQSQLSNDIALLTSASSQLSAYCNPKGRILAQFLVVPANENYLLILPLNIIEKTLQRLRMFVMRSQVELTDVTDELICFGLIGNHTDSQELSLPENDYQLTTTQTVLSIKIPAPVDRYLIVAPVDQAILLWDSLKSKHSFCSHHVWQWLDIQAGIPSIVKETVEEFVPQMVNLELIDGVNFKKGCYPGQEIVARMHYLGKAKRRMFKLHSDELHPPLPGTDLYLNEGDGQSAGKIVAAEPAKTEGIDLLAVIRLSHENSDQLRIGSTDGPVVEFSEQPYPLDQE